MLVFVCVNYGYVKNLNAKLNTQEEAKMESARDIKKKKKKKMFSDISRTQVESTQVIKAVFRRGPKVYIQKEGEKKGRD